MTAIPRSRASVVMTTGVCVRGGCCSLPAGSPRIFPLKVAILPVPGGRIGLGSSYPAEGPSGFLFQERQRALICGVITRGEPAADTLRNAPSNSCDVPSNSCDVLPVRLSSGSSAVHGRNHDSEAIGDVRKITAVLGKTVSKG